MRDKVRQSTTFRPTKSQNEGSKAISCFSFELILSQKQGGAMKSSKRQRTANRNIHQKPKRATESKKEHFSFQFSFIGISFGLMKSG